jgi:hypothetical protein
MAKPRNDTRSAPVPTANWRRGVRSLTASIAMAATSVSAVADDQPTRPASALLVNPAAPTERLEELPQPLPAADQGLSLADLECMALANNPALRRAAALVGAARGNWVQVGLKPNPSVGYEGQQLGSGGLAEQHAVTFGQEIITGGKLQLNRDVARGGLAVAEQ